MANIAQAAKPKVQRHSPASASAKSAPAIEERLRAVIKAMLGERPLDRRDLGCPRVEAFLAGRGPLLVEDLGTFARLLETSEAALLAEAIGGGTLIAKVKLHEQFIPVMEWWQAEMENMRSAIVSSPREDAMLEGDEEQDEATQMRALLECIGRQHLADTIATAQQMVDWRPKGKK